MTKPPSRDEIEDLLKLAERATKLPWHWATSNSTRRLSNEQQDGKVAFGQIHPIDKSADIAISDRDMEYSEAACNAVPQLCHLALALLDRVAVLESGQKSTNEIKCGESGVEAPAPLNTSNL